MPNRAFEITILESYCKGCGLCVDVCAEGKLRIKIQAGKQQNAATNSKLTQKAKLKSK